MISTLILTFKNISVLPVNDSLMGNILRWYIERQISNTTKFASSLFVLTALLLFVQNYDIGFSQTGELGLSSNSTNMTVPSPGASQPSPGFVSKGTINTVINVPNGKWLATGNWSMIVNNGNVTSFETKMTWYNSSGTNAHIHDLTNFKSVPSETQLPMTISGKQTVIKGVSDVSSNGKVSWPEVPTTITVNDRRIISITVDDTKTNHHFGGQPLLGIVESFVPCSDQPGANMEILPACSGLSVEEQSIGLPNDTLAFPPSEGSIPYQEGFPGEQFLPEDQTGGQGEQSLPEDQTGGQGGEQSLPFEDQTGGQGGEQSLPEDQTGGGEGGEETSEINPECNELNIENITANGFETDPSDYHPPSDAIDGDSSTWWSNNEENSWVELNLGQPNTICGLAVEWNKGDTRDYSFKIEISGNSSDYEQVFEGKNKKGSSIEETYPFEETEGQFIKLTVTRTNSNDGWVSIKEIKAIGVPLP
jgi:hypothetical protein